ncbi:MAG TPA: L,D-transpeptidase family protein [Chryseosolibacter sp.]
MERRATGYMSVLALVVALFTYGCQTRMTKIGQVNERLEVPGFESKAEAVFEMPSDSIDPVYEGIEEAVFGFYRDFDFRMVWSDRGSLNPLGDSLVSFIRNIRYYGLLPTSYRLAQIQAVHRNLTLKESMLRREALLTDAFLKISKHLQDGRLPEARQVQADYMSPLHRILASESVRSVFASLEPPFKEYHALKNALRVAIDSLPTDIRPAVLSNLFVPESAEYRRVQTIEINVERWRQETDFSQKRSILVNIPAFMLYVFANDAVIFESKTIVGARETPTPELNGTIECFVTYPYWHVPKSIATREYFHVIQKDTAFLSKNNFDVLDRRGNLLNADSIDWSKFSKDYFPVVLRQREGTGNALGIIKFIFDNPHGVLLHDTNAKRLFRSNVRAFSHGCIRMEKANELAHYLVTTDVAKKSLLIERYLTEKVRHTVNLQEPMPIHVRYFTCWADDNVVRYFPDVYAKDQAMIEALYGNPPERL